MFFDQFGSWVGIYVQLKQVALSCRVVQLTAYGLHLACKKLTCGPWAPAWLLLTPLLKSAAGLSGAEQHNGMPGELACLSDSTFGELMLLAQQRQG